MSAPVALVTGAGGALGRAISLRLAADGYRLALTDRDLSTLQQTEQQVGDHVGAADTLVEALDLTDHDAIRDFFSRVATRLGAVGALVNNAAIYPTVPFLDMDLETYERVHAVNQEGYWLCAQLAGRQMAQLPMDQNRSIVNVSSITRSGGWSDLSAYVVTKHAAIGLTRVLARELGPLGIRANAVSPGAFRTAAEEIHPDPEGYHQMVIDQQSLKRRGENSELASVVAFLLGSDASFVTGQTLEVNGGWVMA